MLFKFNSKVWRAIFGESKKTNEPKTTVSSANISGKEISPAELDGRFMAAPDNPLWEATLTVLAQRINELATSAADEMLTDRQILWRTAGVDALMDFMEELRTREQQAREMQEEGGDEHE